MQMHKRSVGLLGIDNKERIRGVWRSRGAGCNIQVKSENRFTELKGGDE